MGIHQAWRIRFNFIKKQYRLINGCNPSANRN
jgi:hypothetical protein